MAENPKIEISDEQVKEIGMIVADNLGCHFQTRYGVATGTVYLHFQKSLDGATKSAEISKDGEVRFYA